MKKLKEQRLWTQNVADHRYDKGQRDTVMEGSEVKGKVLRPGLTIHFGFNFSNSLSKLLLKIQRLQPLLVMIYPAREGKKKD